mmetsp:Transcript_7000/g.13067  ORF Transcript_7000/g.13067 Transcript_7000/m.13067 type:complete len:284 (-) Transcript_7000:393-1244(-)
MVPVRASSVSPMLFRGYPLRSSSMPCAPCLNVCPQSPSPTLLSHAVRRGSPSFKTSAAATRMRSIRAPLSVSWSGRENTLSSPLGTGMSCFLSFRAPPPRGHPGAIVSMSSPSRRVWRVSPSSFIRDRLRPAMSMEVTRGPEMMRSTTRPISCSRWLTTPRVQMDTSRGVAEPRLLTRTPTWSPLANFMKPRPSEGSVMVLTILATRSSTFSIPILAAPGSPWMPKPISSCWSPILCTSSSRPGTWHTDADTPMLAMAPVAALASFVTCWRFPPFSAAAPAIL